MYYVKGLKIAIYRSILALNKCNYEKRCNFCLKLIWWNKFSKWPYGHETILRKLHWESFSRIITFHMKLLSRWPAFLHSVTGALLTYSVFSRRASRHPVHGPRMFPLNPDIQDIHNLRTRGKFHVSFSHGASYFKSTIPTAKQHNQVLILYVLIHFNTLFKISSLRQRDLPNKL